MRASYIDPGLDSMTERFCLGLWHGGSGDISSVGGGGGYSPPHWPVNQNAEEEKYYIFSSFETVFCDGID